MATEAKTAIVTGASQGIGAGIAKAFLDRGYRVVANCAPHHHVNSISRSIVVRHVSSVGRRRHW